MKDTHHYSDDEQCKISNLMARSLGLVACIHKFSIAECPMERYKGSLEGSHLIAAMFREISFLQKNSKAWQRVSLGSVALKIKEIISHSVCSENIHLMMLDVKATYTTLNFHMKNTINEMAAIARLDSRTITQYVGSREKRHLEPLTDHSEIPLNEMQHLKKLKSRIDDMFVFFKGDDSILRNMCDMKKETGGRIINLNGPFAEIKALLLFIHRANVPTVCIMMTRLHQIMESIENEIQDMIAEFSTWKIRICSMALHPRAGEHSALRLIGCDLMKLVFNKLEI